MENHRTNEEDVIAQEVKSSVEGTCYGLIVKCGRGLVGRHSEEVFPQILKRHPINAV